MGGVLVAASEWRYPLVRNRLSCWKPVVVVGQVT